MTTARAIAYVDCKNGLIDAEIVYRERCNVPGRLLCTDWLDRDSVIDRGIAADTPLDSVDYPTADGLVTSVETNGMTPAEVATALRRVLDDISLMGAIVDNNHCNVQQVVDQLVQRGLWS